MGHALPTDIYVAFSSFLRLIQITGSFSWRNHLGLNEPQLMTFRLLGACANVISKDQVK